MIQLFQISVTQLMDSVDLADEMTSARQIKVLTINLKHASKSNETSNLCPKTYHFRRFIYQIHCRLYQIGAKLVLSGNLIQ